MSILENEQEFLNSKIETVFRLAKETAAQDGDEITIKGVRKLAQVWLEAKRPLIELLGGQTRIEKVVESELELEDARKFVKTFMDKIIQGKFTYKREDYLMQRLKFNSSDFIYDLNGILNSKEGVSALHNNTVTDELVENVRFTRICSNVGVDPKRQKGAKFTKFFLTVFKAGMEKFNLLQDAEAIKELDIISQDFSQLINTMKTAKRRQTVVLSCDLEDFITMSMGTSWDSCHQLGKMYGMGAIAYAQSPNVLITYVKSEDHEYRKKWRQIIYCDVESGFAVGSRQYPSPNNVATDGARNLWQECYNMHNNGTRETTNFKYSKSPQGLRGRLKKSNGFAYVDILEFSPSSDKINGHVWSTWINGTEKPTINCCPREIVCLKCGNLHRNVRSYKVSCGECPRQGELKCRECGRWHTEETCTYVDREGGYICSGCLRSDYTYCPMCQQWERDYNITTVNGARICETCALDNFYRCGNCGEWHEKTESRPAYRNGRKQHYCPTCVQHNEIGICSCCNTPRFVEDLTDTHDGEKVCRHCLHQRYVQCEVCGEYHKRLTIHVVERDGERVRMCEGCREHEGLTGTPLTRELAGQVEDSESSTSRTDTATLYHSFLGRMRR
jgi:hypothetical protein